MRSLIWGCTVCQSPSPDFAGSPFYTALLPHSDKNKQETHGPQLARLSKTATADMQMECNIFPILSNIEIYDKANTLNIFWDILLTRLKCWNFQNAISKKKSSDIFQKSFDSSTYPVL